jgi:ribosomal protein S12 methylthiotransferase accessory factor
VGTETRDPETRDLLAHLDRHGLEVIVKLAATDFGMANLYVVGYDRNLKEAPHPLALSACGEAAHPSRELALRKSLLEYVAARARKLFNHVPLAMIETVAPRATSTASAKIRSAAKKIGHSRRCSNGSPSLSEGCTTC